MWDDVGERLGRTKKLHHGTPLRRPEGSPTPCWKCPKQSPSEAKRMELSDKNWRTWRIYQQVQATGGGCLTEAMKRDAVLNRNLGDIYDLLSSLSRERQELLILAIGARR